MFYNEGDIEQALEISRNRAPELYPFVKFLSDWKDTINANSDGWAHWNAGRKSADKLVIAIDGMMNALREGRELPDEKVFTKALTPIRSAATRFNLLAPDLEDAPAPGFGR